MSYATTGADAVMWNASPMVVPLTFVPECGGVAPPMFVGHENPPPLDRKSTATCPGGICPLGRSEYVSAWPLPAGMRAKLAIVYIVAPRFAVSVTGAFHVFATK